MTMADTIAVMHKGHIERMGAPVEIYEDPRTAFVAGFLGASNLMGGTVDGSTGRVALPGGITIHGTPSKLPASGGTVRQEIALKRGLTSDQAKELAKRIRESFPKTKPVIQGDAVRVSAKSKDELQAVIADLRALDYPVALQFTNYR